MLRMAIIIGLSVALSPLAIPLTAIAVTAQLKESHERRRAAKMQLFRLAWAPPETSRRADAIAKIAPEFLPRPLPGTRCPRCHHAAGAHPSIPCALCKPTRVVA